MPPRKRGWGRVVLARLPQEEPLCVILPPDNPSTSPSPLLTKEGKETAEIVNEC